MWKATKPMSFKARRTSSIYHIVRALSSNFAIWQKNVHFPAGGDGLRKSSSKMVTAFGGCRIFSPAVNLSMGLSARVLIRLWPSLVLSTFLMKFRFHQYLHHWVFND